MPDTTPPATIVQDGQTYVLKMPWYNDKMVVTQLIQLAFLLLSILQNGRTSDRAADARTMAEAAVVAADTNAAKGEAGRRVLEQKVTAVHEDVEQVKKFTAPNPNADK
jgi:creatinine amidohydrolase/Fe(II)-dependent formamide hydrolase-like protein